MCRVGLKLLSRVRPSEIFLKTVTKDVTEVDIAYPARLGFLCSFFFFCLEDLTMEECLLKFDILAQNHLVMRGETH